MSFLDTRNRMDYVNESLQRYKNSDPDFDGYDYNMIQNMSLSCPISDVSLGKITSVVDRAFHDVKKEYNCALKEKNKRQEQLRLISSACLIRRQLYLEYDKNKNEKDNNFIHEVRRLLFKIDEYKKNYGEYFDDVDDMIYTCLFDNLTPEYLDEFISIKKNNHYKNYNYKDTITDQEIRGAVEDAYAEIERKIDAYYNRVQYMYFTSSNNHVRDAYCDLNDLRSSMDFSSDISSLSMEAESYRDTLASQYESMMNKISREKYDDLNDTIFAFLTLYRRLNRSVYSQHTDYKEANRAHNEIKTMHIKDEDYSNEQVLSLIPEIDAYFDKKSKKTKIINDINENVSKIKKYIKDNWRSSAYYEKHGR